MERTLAEALAGDDANEDRGMHGDDRTTCGTHRTWVEDCVSDPLHANPVTKYNWCDEHWSPVQTCRCRTASLGG